MTVKQQEIPSKAIRREAAAWLALRQARELTLSEHASLAEWCSADPRHRQALLEAEATWRTLDKLRNFPHPADLPADPDLLLQPRPASRRVPAGAWVGLAAAAAVAVAMVWMKPSKPSPTASLPAESQAGYRIRHLSDGSEVELNAGALLEEHYTAGERRVRLVRGEAHFTVTRNPGRPFLVEANGIAVRAIGTAFDIRIERETIAVLVTEGKVQVAPSTETVPGDRTPPSGKIPPTYMVAGQRSVVPVRWAASPEIPLVVETLTPQQVDLALAWQSARLVFDSIPLAEAAERFNRHLVGKPGAPRLLIGDARAGAVLVSGRVRADNLESFVEVLESSFDIKAERGVAGEITLRKAH